ncbi:thiol-disulfide oxidoreductase DCC family protein, partial [Anoxybacillus kestanbolensis]|uniref:thiol-disulfide oxidoreductase DCC family protein n=1 Tax=Anoxybacillus kestanbolensis TaxID=227476 RepID=UPI003D1FE0BB
MKKKLLSKLLPKSTITIYYDGYCAFCNKIVSKWKEKDHYEKLIFKSFREESVQAEIAVSLIDLDKEIHAKNNDNNKMYKGIYVVTEVSKRIPSLWFMVPLLYLPESVTK